ncbi:hypothetical protein CI109_104616 [Kwoniella shandongensis]|uniref:Uncharacterized protein n=1 Tax=Kwoniella shandongensis TaxID=1734106 RepID=A0A5M6BWV5_9TREE|nr:uncharacterized protein CI109_004781 [Kwoniella shandongensis]KAA5526781.1 hypothetical protein CI109_004781 [Kwoniella shandongensis]
MMLRSLLSSSSSRSRQQGTPSSPKASLVCSSTTRTVPRLIPELLPLVVPYADTPTLFNLCLVDIHTSHLAHPLLYDVVQLHSPDAIIRFIQRPPAARRRKIKHIDVLLDPLFVRHREFRRATLNKDKSHPQYGWDRLDGLNSLHLTTKGEDKFKRVSKKGFRTVETDWSIQDLIKIWVGERIAPSQGPAHFRWRHIDINKNKLMEEESPYHTFRWPFEFLSDWTNVISIDLPLTQYPINEGFHLSSLEIKAIQYFSIAGRTLASNALSRIISDVINHQRDQKEENGNGKRKVLEVREPVDELIREGLEQLKREEDKAYLRVVVRPTRRESAAEWRYRVGKGEWMDT